MNLFKDFVKEFYGLKEWQRGARYSIALAAMACKRIEIFGMRARKYK